MIHKVLSIAGFDGSGGAGLQADLKTFSALGCYGTTILTGLPVQNTQGVFHYHDIPLESIEQQLKVMFDDGPIDAIKIGMLPNASVMQLIADFLKQHAHCPIVIDPVMIAKSGHALLDPNAISALIQFILPLAIIITPNLPEAETLLGKKIQTQDDMENAAKALLSFGPRAVLLKGGHLQHNEAHDLFVNGTHLEWFSSERITTHNTHGTGCTLSACLAACLAQGLSLRDAVIKSKIYITAAIEAGASLTLGKGNGPVHHFYHLWPSLNKI